MVAFAAATSGGLGTASFSHNSGTGGSRILWVVTSSDGGGASGVTYGGVAMTELVSASFSLGAFTVKVWYLLNPLSGSNTVAASGMGGTFTVGALTYSGARQAGIPDAVAVSSGSGTPYTKSLTTVTPNAWILFVTMNDINTSAASTGSTQRIASAGVVLDIYDSNGPLAPGSNSMSVTQAGGPNWGSAMVSFAPDVPSMFVVF